MIESAISAIHSAFIEQLVKDPVWGTVGFIGQFVFGARFILQWLVSEYKKKSHIPNSFWYISLAGSLILLAYSLHLKNPIFVLGFSLNTLIYVRNIHLIYNQKSRVEN